MLAVLSNIKVLAITAATTSVIAIGGYLYWQINKLQHDIIVMKANEQIYENAIETQHKTIDTLRTSLTDTINNQNDLFNKFSEYNTVQNNIEAQLDEYRGRLGNAALNKPTLVERRINNTTSMLLQQFSEATGSNSGTADN